MNKYVRIGLIVTGAIIVVFVAYLLIPKSYISLAVAPDDVMITIDGGKSKPAHSGKTILVWAGKHTYLISHDGFKPLTVTLEAGNNETKELLAALEPLNDDASTLLETESSQIVVQKYYAKQQVTVVNKLDSTYPILKDLPIYARLYSIMSCPSQKFPNDATKIALCVDMSEDGLEPYAAKDLESRGYNPADFEIIYTRPDDTATLNDDQGN